VTDGRNNRGGVSTLVGVATAIILSIATPVWAAPDADPANEFVHGVTVTMDQARVMRLPARVSTIVIGNPLIADATVQSGGIIVLTGKGIGSTNLIALDNRGEQLLSTSLRVRPQSQNIVRVYRGIERETYSCTPSCERTVAVGDTSPYFDAAINQSGNRSAASSAASGAAAAPAR